MLDSTRPFDIQGLTDNIAVTASSQALLLTALPTNKDRSIRLVNSGTQVVFFVLSHVSPTATTAMTPLLANTAETFLLKKDVQFVGVIAASTGSTLYATVGESA